jgi:undecaprenyl diphosphate synthase
MSLKEKINLDNLPKHIAIIMDGNGRWAKQQGKNRIFGHKKGVETVRLISEICAKIGVKYLTLYAFSTENWNRPKLEIIALMELLVLTISRETKTLMKNNIRLQTIGDLSKMPEKVRKELSKIKEATKNNAAMDLILALNYSGRAELVNAVKKIALEVKKGEIDIEKISDLDINRNLYTSKIPEPELMIRTSGELRLSNFLLWQSAYTELHFTKEFWPAFGKESLFEAIIDFQNRERRFGKTSEQLN